MSSPQGIKATRAVNLFAVDWPAKERAPRTLNHRNTSEAYRIAHAQRIRRCRGHGEIPRYCRYAQELEPGRMSSENDCESIVMPGIAVEPHGGSVAGSLRSSIHRGRAYKTGWRDQTAQGLGTDAVWAVGFNAGNPEGTL